MTSTKYIDYLKEDPPIPGQLWVCVSFLSPEGIKNCSVRGLKIRGVFGTRQEADGRAEELRKLDPDFHVFVGEVGKWLPWDPDPNDVQDQVYQEKQLQEIAKGYKDNLQMSKAQHEARKEQMIRQAAMQEQSQQRSSKTKDRLQKKLAAKKQKQKIDTIAAQSIDNPKIKLMEDELNIRNEQIKTEMQKIDDTQKQIDNKKQNLESIEDKLAKIQELYNKMNS